MSWMHRFRSSFQKRRLEGQLNDELQLHIEMPTWEFVRPGSHRVSSSPSLAPVRKSVLQEERTRDMDIVYSIETARQDLHYASRTLRRSPGFTVAVVLSIALGIAANTTVFSIVNALQLGALPINEPQRLLNFNEANSFSYPDYIDYRD
jgi:hypothetical protein